MISKQIAARADILNIYLMGRGGVVFEWDIYIYRNKCTKKSSVTRKLANLSMSLAQLIPAFSLHFSW
jgi:hypothetical protein